MASARRQPWQFGLLWPITHSYMNLTPSTWCGLSLHARYWHGWWISQIVTERVKLLAENRAHSLCQVSQGCCHSLIEGFEIHSRWCFLWQNPIVKNRNQNFDYVVNDEAKILFMSHIFSLTARGWAHDGRFQFFCHKSVLREPMKMNKNNIF